MSSENRGHEIDAELEKLYGEIMDLNHLIFSVTRERMDELSAIRDAYQVQIARIEKVLELLTEGAAFVAQINGDLLANEFNLIQDEDEDEDDQDENENERPFG